jgi:PAS domain S-box-containing protein
MRQIAENQSSVFNSPEVELKNALARLFDVFLPATVLFGGVAFAWSVYQSLSHGRYLELYVHSAMYAIALLLLVFRRYFPVMLIFSVMICLVGIDVVHSLFTSGMAGSAMVGFVVVSIFLGVFFGKRAGLTSLATGVVVILLVGAGIWQGIFTMNDNAIRHLSDPGTWIIQIAMAVLYSVPLILTVNGVRGKVVRSLNDLQDANRQLEKEVETRRTAEEELRESEKKYRRIFEHAVEGIFQTTGSRQMGRANPALARMFGFDHPDELIDFLNAHGPGFFADDKDVSRIRDILQKQRFIEGYEMKVRRRDNSEIWISMSGQLVGGDDDETGVVEGIVEDITQRKQAEIALHESEARYRSLVETSLVAFFIMQDGLFRFVNSHFCEISGYTAEEIIDKLGPKDLIHESDHAWFMELLKNGMQYHGPVTREFKGVKKGGIVTTIKMTWSVCDVGGKPAVVGTAIDVTKEAMLESQLLHAQKMEAVGTLAGGVAHDFNNILMALMGYGSMLQLRMKKNDPLKPYADQIIACTERASTLTQNLLAFSRKQRVEVRPCEVNTIVKNIEKLLRRLLPEDIEFVFVLVKDVTVMADISQIEQVLMNLATNARDAMPGGGQLRIEASEVEIDGSFIAAHGYGEPGKYALISVTDTGMGMDEETQKKIFEPFFTTKEVGKGTGLGLSIIYGIVKQHKGYIEVLSAPGEGTTFNIYLPAGEKVVTAAELPYPEIKGGTETILFVEDNNDIRKVTTEIIRTKGYSVIEAVDGEDGLKKFVEHRDDVALVIMDAIMPRMNGKETYRKMRKIKPAVKALFVSGYTRDAILGKGVYDYLPKPVPPEKLLGTIREIIDK